MAKQKTLNERVDDALDAVNAAREAIDGAGVQSGEIAGAVKSLSKAAAKLRSVLEDVSEIFDDVESALGTIESELESLQDLKLSAHVDTLETVVEVLDDVSQLDLSTE